MSKKNNIGFLGLRMIGTVIFAIGIFILISIFSWILAYGSAIRTSEKKFCPQLMATDSFVECPQPDGTYKLFSCESNTGVWDYDIVVDCRWIKTLAEVK